MVITGDIGTQTRRVLDNISSILRAAGSDLSKVVRSTVYFEEHGRFPCNERNLGAIFHVRAPARSTIQVVLIRDALVEIDVVALA
jgi:2-iminobutanoate/2-iminopropanoate deaminase